MSIYIKGMELPKEEPIKITICPNGQVIKANAAEYEEYEAANILAHGRLIEADKLAEKCDDPYWCVWLSDIDDAPTIIPAESEE